ncbi:MAG: alpha/beta fold hydrolase [Gammaproteobacteria bacterium]
MNSHHVFELGDVELQSGGTLPGAKLAYQTYGRLSAAGDNAVLLPAFYTGTHARNEGFFGAGRALDPRRHFIISVNLFGNGLSSSPSNMPPPHDRANFPAVSFADNIDCQLRLLREQLHVERLALVAGWSMAGCQAFHWAARHPEMVGAILPFCASARTSPHNRVFLEGVKAALLADRAEPPRAGLKAFARVYAGWAYSQTFYREKLHRRLGHDSFEELLLQWERDHLEWDANDLLAMLRTWQSGDISDNPRDCGDFPAALRAITAKTIIIACSDDLYFPPADNAFEAAHIAGAELRVFDSPWGHAAASPGNVPEFSDFLDRAILDLLG